MFSLSTKFTNLCAMQSQIILIVFITLVHSEAILKSTYLPPKNCPSGSVGNYPNCKCPESFTGVPPNCRAAEYLPPDIPKCPEGYYGTFPNCHEPCPPYHIGYQPECVRMKCLPGYKGEYQPDCVKVDCPEGEIGLYPNCVKPTTERYYEVKECPAGQIGTPPNCRAQCPYFTYGEPPNCKRMKCPDGWEGDYQPNCQLKPKCPKDKVGVWPNCISKYCPAGTVGTFPDCRCPPGSIGTPPNCKATTTGYLPPYVQSGYLPPHKQHENQYLRSDSFQNIDLLPPHF